MRALAVCLITLAPAASAQGRIIVDTLHSQALRGNLIGDTPDRAITIYLPPSYQRDWARRYPVLYLLHGVTSAPIEWLDGTYQGFDLRLAMDSLAGAGRAEYLVVMPFADNSLGGSFYVNSAAFGGWDDFIVKELVRFVDARFRTRTDAKSRGLAGQSMGGFGALYLVGRHPGTFGHVYAMSPCCLGFVGEFAQESELWTTSPMPARLRAIAAAFAPQRRGRAAIEAPLPFTRDSLHHLREVAGVARAWRAHLPLERLKADQRPYRRLCSIALEFGSQDQIASVRLGTPAFATELRQTGIPHILDEFEGGHTDHTRERFERALLPFFAGAFAARDCHGPARGS